MDSQSNKTSVKDYTMSDETREAISRYIAAKFEAANVGMDMSVLSLEEAINYFVKSVNVDSETLDEMMIRIEQMRSEDSSYIGDVGREYFFAHLKGGMSFGVEKEYPAQPRPVQPSISYGKYGGASPEATRLDKLMDWLFGR